MSERLAAIAERMITGADFTGWYDTGIGIVLWAIEVGSDDTLSMKEFNKLARDAEDATHKLYRKIGLPGHYGSGKATLVMSVRGKVAALAKVQVDVNDWSGTEKLLAESGVKEGKP